MSRATDTSAQNSLDPTSNVATCDLPVTDTGGFRGAQLLEPIRHKVIAFDSVYYPALEEHIWRGGKWTRGPVPPAELAFRRRRDRKSKANTGASAALASHIRAFEVLPPHGCSWYPNSEDSPGFLVHDPGAFHWHTINQAARKESPDKANVAEHDTSLSDFVRQKRDSMRRNSLLPEAPSPQDFWAGDDDTPDFIEGTGHVFERGRGRNKTDDEDFEDREEYEVKRAKYEAMLQAGDGWSPLDPPEDTRVLPIGVKVNLSNELVKQMQYDIRLHWEDYKTKQTLAEELGLKYETVRKKELEDINMKKEQPNTPFTAEQMKDFNARGGNVVYVHAEGLDRPRWFTLDMDRHETYHEAIEEVRWKSQDEAFKKARVPSRRTDKRTHQDHPELARAFKEVVVRYELAFRRENLYILDLRSPMVVAIAVEAWNENGVPNTTFAPEV